MASFPVNQSSSSATNSGSTKSDITKLIKFDTDFTAAISSMTPWRDDFAKIRRTHNDQARSYQELIDLMQQHFSGDNMAAFAETNAAIAKAVTTNTATLEMAVRGVEQPARRHLKALLEAFHGLVGSEELRECFHEVLMQQSGPLKISSDALSSAGPDTAHPSTTRGAHTPILPREHVLERAREVAEAETAQAAGTGKRRNSAAEHDTSSAAKRRNVDKPTRRPGTIEFDEVSNHPKYKYHILEKEFWNPRTGVKGRFWILRCDQDDLHYAHKSGEDRRVYNTAARHIEGKAHNLPGTDESVLEALGVAVLNCDKDKADKNNKAVVAAFKEKAYKAPTTMVKTPVRATRTRQRALRRRRRAYKRLPERANDHSDDDDDYGDNGDDDDDDPDSHDSDSADNPPGEVPVPGYLYLAYWGARKRRHVETSKDWFAVLSIPMEDNGDGFSSVGLGADYVTSGLEKIIPNYYQLHRDGRKAVVRLKPEFPELADGMSQAGDKMYPFLFFDSTQDFLDCKYGWVPLENIKPFHEDGFDKKYLPKLHTYLRYCYRPPNTPESLLPPLLAANEGEEDDIASQSSDDFEEAPHAPIKKRRQKRAQKQPSLLDSATVDNNSVENGPRGSSRSQKRVVYRAPYVEDVNEPSSANSARVPSTEADPYNIPEAIEELEHNNVGTVDAESTKQSSNSGGSQCPAQAAAPASDPVPTSAPLAEMSATEGPYDDDDDTPVITSWRILSDEIDSKSHRYPSPVIETPDPWFPPPQKAQGGATASSNVQSQYRGPLGFTSAANASTPSPSCQPGKENQSHQYQKVARKVPPPDSSTANNPGSAASSSPGQGSKKGKPPVMSMRQEFFQQFQQFQQQPSTVGR